MLHLPGRWRTVVLVKTTEMWPIGTDEMRLQAMNVPGNPFANPMPRHRNYCEFANHGSMGTHAWECEALRVERIGRLGGWAAGPNRANGQPLAELHPARPISAAHFASSSKTTGNDVDDNLKTKLPTFSTLPPLKTPLSGPATRRSQWRPRSPPSSSAPPSGPPRAPPSARPAPCPSRLAGQATPSRWSVSPNGDPLRSNRPRSR